MSQEVCNNVHASVNNISLVYSDPARINSAAPDSPGQGAEHWAELHKLVDNVIKMLQVAPGHTDFAAHAAERLKAHTTAGHSEFAASLCAPRLRS